MNITEMQQSGQVVHVIKRRAAASLVKRGLARYTVIQPVPVDGVAVNLTVLGKSWKRPSQTSEVDVTTEAPEPEQPTE